MTKRFSISRIWINTISKSPKSEIVDHSLGDLANHVSSRTAYKSGPNNLVSSFSAMNLVKTSPLLTNSPIAFVKVFGVSLILDVLLLELDLVHAHRCNFWIGVSAIRKDDFIFVLFISIEKCVSYNIPGMNIRVVCKLRSRNAITNRKNVLIVGLQELVNFDSKAVILDASNFESQIFSVRYSSCGNHHNIHFLCRNLLSLYTLICNTSTIIFNLLKFNGFGLKLELNPIFKHLLLQVGNTVFVISW